MKFGRLQNVDTVDFSLPDASCALTGWEEDGSGDEFRLYVGAPVWAHKSFVGKIYPPKTKASEYLHLYAQNFNCIELNSTFYGIPKADRIAGWREKVGPEFRFCPKAPRSITHEAGFLPRNEVAAFFRAMEFFGEHLGAIFFQFPPELGPGQWRRLQDLMQLVPKGFDIAVELRSADWFSSREALEGLWKLGVHNDVMFVISDTAGRRDVLHFCFPKPQAFVRFSADALVPSDFARLDNWIEALREFRKRGMKSAYFFLHQESEGKCVELVEHMSAQMPEAGLPPIKRVQSQEQLTLF